MVKGNGRRDNRGSGIITVIITVTFITALGATLLFMTYMNLQMKNADRAARRSFYTTEMVMDQMRVALQNSVSEAIESAYTSSLVLYGESMNNPANNPQAQFADAFVRSIGPKLGIVIAPGILEPDTGEAVKVMTYTSDEFLKIMRPYMSTEMLGAVAVGAAPTAVIRFDEATKAIPVAIEIQGLSAATQDGDGYANTIYSDFVINIPPFSAVSAGFYSRLSNYIIVADEALIASGNAKTVNLQGNVYAGRIEVKGTDYNLNIDGGRVISKGDYDVMDGASLTIGNKASIWANGINLHKSAKAELLGSVYVADDLELKGVGATATIKGSYFGFGNNPADSQKSSSIIVSGRGSQLNFTDLKTLVLAGRSFISGSEDSTLPATSADVAMANSLSVKSDQIAYLVPDSMLMYVDGSSLSRVSNPRVWPNSTLIPQVYLAVYDATGALTGHTNLDGTVVLDTDLPAKYIRISLSEELQAAGAKVTCRYEQLPSTADTAMYFFLTFTDDEARAEYFEQYYADNTGKLNEYLKLYFAPGTAGRINATGALNTSGYVYQYDIGTSAYTLRATAHTQHIDTMAKTYQRQYQNLITTLLESEEDTTNTSPFTHFVDVSRIAVDYGSAGGPVEFKNAAGKVLAVIVPDGYGDFKLTMSNYPDVHVVVACGTGANIVVDREFHGLLLSEGRVTIADSLTTGTLLTDGVAGGKAYEAFHAKNGDNLLLDYMKGSTRGSDPATTEATSWNLNDLVGYHNWTKNEVRK